MLEVIDESFGKMVYNHRWEKHETMTMWGKEYDITVIAKAFSEKPITVEQRFAYDLFKRLYDKYVQNIEKSVKEYIAKEIEYIKEVYPKADELLKKDITELITPKSLIIKNNGSFFILANCVWDSEGIGIALKPESSVGPQSSFL